MCNREEELNKNMEILIDHFSHREVGFGVSISYIQRKLRVGYKMAEDLIVLLAEKGVLESYPRWIGTTVDGERTDGYEMIFYRIAQR